MRVRLMLGKKSALKIEYINRGVRVLGFLGKRVALTQFVQASEN